MSVWPIAIIGSSYHEGPVCTDGKVIGWGGDIVKGNSNKFQIPATGTIMLRCVQFVTRIVYIELHLFAIY